MVGIHRLLKIDKMVGIHRIVKKLVIWWVSTAYPKFGNMVGIRRLFKIQAGMVGTHHQGQIWTGQ